MDFEGRTFRKAQFDYDYGSAHIKEPPVRMKDANVVCSDVKGTGHSCPVSFCNHQSHSEHKPVLDIDVPMTLIPSSTKGHFHLYIDHPVSWDAYCKLLDALVECRIVEEDYAYASKNRGYTAVRLPWVKKQSGEEETL